MLDVESVRPELLEIFAPAEAERQRVLALESRTDRDFMDGSGNVDEGKKNAGHKQVNAAKTAFEEHLEEGLETIWKSGTIANGIDKLILSCSLEDRLNGWAKLPQFAFTPDGSETAVDYAISETNRFQTVLDWWNNPSELFAYFQQDSVRLYHSPPIGRVGLLGAYDRHDRPAVVAEFNTGVTMAKGTSEIPLDPTDAHKLQVGLFGWDGTNHVRREDFKGDGQNKYKFLDAESVTDLSSKQRFYLRMAQEILAETVEFETVEIPAPQTEYREDLCQAIGDAIIQESIGLELALHPEGFSTGRHREWSLGATHTPITALTKQGLHRVLRAANISRSRQGYAINVALEQLKKSDHLSDYFKAVRAEPIAKRFIAEVLEA